jgi:hypothetical protein
MQLALKVIRHITLMTYDNNLEQLLLLHYFI